MNLRGETARRGSSRTTHSCPPYDEFEEQERATEHQNTTLEPMRLTRSVLVRGYNVYGAVFVRRNAADLTHACSEAHTRGFRRFSADLGRSRQG